jgi:hypothetical protein
MIIISRGKMIRQSLALPRRGLTRVKVWPSHRICRLLAWI